MIELSKCLQGGFASCCSVIGNYIVQQLDELEIFTQEHSLSVVKLLSQVRLLVCVAFRFSHTHTYA